MVASSRTPWTNTFFRALSAICTHSEVCQVTWDPAREQVLCPCHNAAFDTYGNVLHGPPPRPLRTYPVSVIDGQVYVRIRGEEGRAR